VADLDRQQEPWRRWSNFGLSNADGRDDPPPCFPSCQDAVVADLDRQQEPWRRWLNFGLSNADGRDDPPPCFLTTPFLSLPPAAADRFTKCSFAQIINSCSSTLLETDSLVINSSV
jgi:hypothetical protein